MNTEAIAAESAMSGKLQLHSESFRSVLIEMVYCPKGPATDSAAGQGVLGRQLGA